MSIMFSKFIWSMEKSSLAQTNLWSIEFFGKLNLRPNSFFCLLANLLSWSSISKAASRVHTLSRCNTSWIRSRSSSKGPLSCSMISSLAGPYIGFQHLSLKFIQVAPGFFYSFSVEETLWNGSQNHHDFYVHLCNFSGYFGSYQVMVWPKYHLPIPLSRYYFYTSKMSIK